MFCLEIARRKLCCDSEGNAYDIFYDAPILEIIVIGLNLVNKQKECPIFSFFGCFTGDSRMTIADTFIKKAGLDDRALGKLKLEFYNKRIDGRIIQNECEEYFKNALSDLVNNSKVVDKLKAKGFIHCEPIKNLTPEVLDTTNFSEDIISFCSENHLSRFFLAFRCAFLN